MACQVISSNPESWGISWLKDGTRLREQKTPTLTLSTVTKTMSGKYQCEAFNDLGSGRSDEVVLQVYCEPPGSWEGGRLGVSTGWNQRPLLTSLFCLCTFFQMLQNLPGLRSSPHQLRREIK